MFKRISPLVLLILVLILALTACGGKPVIQKTGVVPDSLQAIEGAAEHIIDVAANGNWDEINADITSIADSWKTYQLQASKDGAPQAIQDTISPALTKLQTAVAAKDVTGTMQSANDLSAAVIELFAIYNPKVPADIGRLDVWERQVVLDIAANHFDAAAVSLAKVKSVWESVKPSVLEHNGNSVAAQFETSIAKQEQALTVKDGVTLTSEAKNGLTLVDALEGLY